MDKEHFVEFYKLFRKNDNVEAIAQRCFAAFDADRDGYVDLGEFLVAYAATSGAAEKREKLDYAFDFYDLDNNMVLDEMELRAVIKLMFGMWGVKEENVNLDTCIANIMHSMDKNKDKKISKTEFIDGMLTDPLLMSLMSPFD